MKLRRWIIFLFIPVLLWQSFYLPLASADTGEVLKQHRFLKQREQQIVAELVKAELALDRMSGESARIQADLSQTRSNIPVAREQLAGAKENLQHCRQRLSLWLRHFYMEGRTHYVMILLGAVNLGDFLNRLALVGVLVSRGVADLNKTLAAVEEVKQRAAELDRLEKQLVARQRELARALEQTKLLQSTKQRLLATIRQELGENQGKVLTVVDGLHEILRPLETLLSRFKDAPWDKYRPDRLHWLGAGVKAEYSEHTLSKLLFSGISLKHPVEACLSNHLLIIKGTNQEQMPFAIAGELAVAGENVCYKIKSIQVGDIAFDKELIDLIAGKEGLTYPVGLLMGWRLQDIQIEEGKAVFELVPA
ncbi:coiled-coil domain-containing protein [Desulforamulus putei]|uniref:Septal ring factor EnvC, activator of murein hydrolases AmiA and AmiB n=1 Tax=Desulforamulus putei DSM 12395 TaxID=1121429 RepID=A0A1M4XF94_9FIRM|nr:hypothetical protein [Desulforamulus putei]SHE92013.1 hypothetical protein SAMN02745133_01428 [Desulforamulus putei DSM 12395]